MNVLSQNGAGMFSRYNRGKLLSVVFSINCNSGTEFAFK